MLRSAPSTLWDSLRKEAIIIRGPGAVPEETGVANGHGNRAAEVRNLHFLSFRWIV